MSSGLFFFSINKEFCQIFLILLYTNIMICLISFLIFGFLVLVLIFNQVKRKRFLFSQISFLNLIILLIFIISGFFSGIGIYNLIKYGSCQKPKVIFEGEAGPLTFEGKCPFDQNEEILCIFMDDIVLKALNLPPAKNQIISSIYKRLPTILQWRVMNSAYQRLNPDDKKIFVKFLSEGDGYQIQLLFYKKIPNYKSIINQELEKLRKETMETLYGRESGQ